MLFAGVLIAEFVGLVVVWSWPGRYSYLHFHAFVVCILPCVQRLWDTQVVYYGARGQVKAHAYRDFIVAKFLIYGRFC